MELENYAIEAIPEKITCPHCGSENCFEEGAHLEIEAPMVYSYMCMGCGYTSTSINKPSNPMVQEYEETTAEIIKALKWIDPQTGLIWYPTVLNFPNSGMIFPEGTGIEDWKWVAAPAIDIDPMEQSKYKIPGTDKYYTRKIDMGSAKKFDPSQFNEACKSIGLIKE